MDLPPGIKIGILYHINLINNDMSKSGTCLNLKTHNIPRYLKRVVLSRQSIMLVISVQMLYLKYNRYLNFLFIPEDPVFVTWYYLSFLNFF
jgi:hypothetical protein